MKSVPSSPEEELRGRSREKAAANMMTSTFAYRFIMQFSTVKRENRIQHEPVSGDRVRIVFLRYLFIAGKCHCCSPERRLQNTSLLPDDLLNPEAGEFISCQPARAHGKEIFCIEKIFGKGLLGFIKCCLPDRSALRNVQQVQGKSD